MILQVSSSVTSVTDFHLEKDGFNSPKIIDSMKSMSTLPRLRVLLELDGRLSLDHLQSLANDWFGGAKISSES
jgi:hypothetical protein